MQKKPSYLNKKLFKNLLENLEQVVDKNNGIIHLKNKDNQKDFISYILGYKNYKNYLNQMMLDSEQTELTQLIKKINLIPNIEGDREIDYIDSSIEFDKKLKKNLNNKKNPTLINVNISHSKIKIGKIYDKSLKTPYDIFVSPNKLQIVTQNFDFFTELIQRHYQANNLLHIHIKNGKKSNIDLIEELTFNDLWEDIFFDQSDEFSILLMTIIQQFFIINDYKIECDLLKESINIEGLLFLMNSDKSSILIKKMIKKYLNKIGLKENDIQNKKISISKEIQTEHIEHAHAILEKVYFIEYLYNEGYFNRTYKTLIQNISDQKNIQINTHYLTNIFLLPIIECYKNQINELKINILNQTDFDLSNLESQHICSISDTIQDNWIDYENTIFSDISKINTNPLFMSCFYNKTQNIIPIFNIKHLSENNEKTFLWQKSAKNEEIYDLYEIQTNYKNQ